MSQMGHHPVLVYRPGVHFRSHGGRCMRDRCIFIYSMLHWGLWFWGSENTSSFSSLFCAFPFPGFDTVFPLKHMYIRKEYGLLSSHLCCPLPPLLAIPRWPQRVSPSRYPELTQQEGPTDLKVPLPLFITECLLFLSCFFSLKDKDRERSLDFSH